MKKQICNFKKGYYRPISLKLWQWLIIMIIWTMTLFFYIMSAYISSWYLIIAILFQVSTFCLMLGMDSGSWRDTKEGKEYIEKYEDNQ